MKQILDFDNGSLRFGMSHVKSAWKIVWRIALYLLYVLMLTVIAYFAFAVFFSTDTERRLKAEIRMYEKLYPELSERDGMMADAITMLQHEDGRIYEQVFHADAPSADPMGSHERYQSAENIPQEMIFTYSARKADSLLAVSSRIDRTFERIFEILSDSTTVIPPMSLPLENVTYTQIGASVGSKLDPSYEAYIFHAGIDFIVPRGEKVLATADGTVTKVENTRRYGRTVEITHEGGYTTIYAHLESISVRLGQKVSRLDPIGTVGMTGKSLAPHLHYELSWEEYTLDPVHYLFASVGPEEYANMLYMAVNTMQSMD